MPKLTDTQLVILSAAARRADGGALPLPKSLKIRGAAVTKILDGLRNKGLLAEKPAARGAAAWREAEDGSRMMLAVTEAGLRAIGATPDEGPRKRATAAKPKKAKHSKPAKRGPAPATPRGKESTAARPRTKQALMIDLLKRKKGATIDEIVEATGWQAHSVRGAISGALKKKLGLTVTSEPNAKRGRVYRIVEPAGAASS